MRLALHDKSCEPLLGRPGVFDTTDRKIKSKPVQIGGHDIIFTGKMDVRVNFDDGTVGVIDAKTSDPSDSSMGIYNRQLHTYHTILTQPGKGEPEVVSMMGLAIVTPEWWEFDPTAETSPFHFRFSFKPVEINEERWNKTLIEVVELLSGSRPEPTWGCSWCTMQRAEEMLIEEDF
jgi:hypothetical protein